MSVLPYNPTVPAWVTIAPNQYAPCVGCGEPTQIRCHGVPGHAVCVPVAPSTVESRTTDQPCPKPALAAAIAARIAAVDTGKTPRFLDALEHECAPIKGGREPYWAPPLPGCTFAVHVPGYTWSRDYDGPVTVLDRSGAWMSAAASVDVAHGALNHTGPIEFTGAPGYYKIQVHPWTEHDLPHPLGTTTRDEIWVTEPTIKLLSELVAADRWPDIAVLDSYTCDTKVRLLDWMELVKAVRTHALTRYGRDSDQYDMVKTNFSQALALMVGKIDGAYKRTWSCRARRPDWWQHTDALCGATMWRWADEIHRIATLVAVRAKDELVIPADMLETVTTTPRSRGRKPLQLDPTGITLGTFKVKEYTGA